MTKKRLINNPVTSRQSSSSDESSESGEATASDDKKPDKPNQLSDSKQVIAKANSEHIVNYFKLSDRPNKETSSSSSSSSETSETTESDPAAILDSNQDKNSDKNKTNSSRAFDEHRQVGAVQCKRTDGKPTNKAAESKPVIAVEESEEDEEEESSSSEDESSDTEDDNLVPVQIVQVTGNKPRIPNQELRRLPQHQTTANKTANQNVSPIVRTAVARTLPNPPTSLTKSQSNFNLTNNLRRQLIQLKKSDVSSSEHEEDVSAESRSQSSSSSSFNPLRHNYYLLKNLNECNLGKSQSQSNVRGGLVNRHKEDVVHAKYTTRHYPAAADNTPASNSTRPQTADPAQNVNGKPLKSILVINNLNYLNSSPKKDRSLVSKVETKLNTKLNTRINGKLSTHLNTQLNTPLKGQLASPAANQPSGPLRNQLNNRLINSSNRLSNNLNAKLNNKTHILNKSNPNLSPVRQENIENRNQSNNRADNSPNRSPSSNQSRRPFNLQPFGEAKRTQPNKMTNKPAAGSEDYMNNTNLVGGNLNESNVIKTLSSKQLAQIDSLKQQQLHNQPTANVNNENINNLKNENNPAVQSPVTQEDLLQPGHVVKGKLSRFILCSFLYITRFCFAHSNTESSR